MQKYVDGILTYMTPAEIAQAEIDAGAMQPPRRIVPLAAVVSRLIVRGEVAQVVAVLDQMPEAKAQFESLEEGIYADDADARAIFTAAGVDPDIILA